jgi:glycosyltransferase involved in cell wall biosynthesis
VRTAAPFVRALESWTLGKAQQINFVSPAFTDYFAPILRDKRVSVHSNGVDDLFADFVNRFPVSGDKPLRPRVVAAGNIGEGQGLHHIVPGLAAAFPGVEFRIIGGGGRRAVLEQAVAESKLGNVVLLDPVARERLLREYAEASVLFMHLNDLAGFDRVIPSKMFEYAATGRPILAGVRGRSQAMLARVAGAETFAPGDVDAAIAALARLLAGPQIHDREEFVARYDRRKIMARMASEILALKSGGDAITAAAPDKGLPDDP